MIVLTLSRLAAEELNVILTFYIKVNFILKKIFYHMMQPLGVI